MILWVDDNVGILFLKIDTGIIYREIIRGNSFIKKRITGDSKIGNNR